MINIGDIVTRKSHNNDIKFVVLDYEENTYYLKGKTVRLYADANLDDLVIDDNEDIEEKEFLKRIKDIRSLDRDNFFYLPGKILHIDGDNDYLLKCLDFYKKNKLQAIGKLENEENIENKIEEWITLYKPNIIVITGHDAYYKNKEYKNSKNFVNAIKKCRDIIRNQEQLIIIAGACQSNYEELICAGANFASSPKRINIHALDPAIIAAEMAFSNTNKEIDIKKILEKTKYGANGLGGIITKGTMHVGYPR